MRAVAVTAWWLDPGSARSERLDLNTSLVEYVGDKESVEYGGGTIELYPVHMVSGKCFSVSHGDAIQIIRRMR